jgi:hypothetical protein
MQTKPRILIFILFFSMRGRLAAWWLVEEEWTRQREGVGQALTELPFPTAHSCIIRSMSRKRHAPIS